MEQNHPGLNESEPALNESGWAMDRYDADPDELTDRDVLDGVVAMSRDINAAMARRTEWIGVVDRRGAYESDGALSTAAWLRHRIGFSPGEARVVVRIARAMGQMLGAAKRFAVGDLDQRRMDQLARAYVAHPDLFERDESMLVDHAEILSSKQFDTAIRYWRQAADDAVADTARHNWERRGLHYVTSDDGVVFGNFRLDASDGAVLIASIESVTDPASRDQHDKRTPAQTRADALVAIHKDHLDHGAAPVTGGDRPQVLLRVDLESLTGTGGGLCELDQTGPITSETARQILCDAAVSRVITRGKSEILDLGRASRTVNAAQRRALIVRDGGCVAAGCDTPPRWCDAHHLVHWIDGGPTNLANLCLFCRRHHTMWHLGTRFPLNLSAGSRDGPIPTGTMGSTLQSAAPPAPNDSGCLAPG